MAYVSDGMIVGLGTGSTADHLLQALGGAIRAGKLKNIRGVPTSRQSERRAEALGIPLTTLALSPTLDLTIDGADEVDPELNLIKGLGGALLREKIVAQNSKRLIIVADSSKAVNRLGTKGPLPVEVAQFAHEVQEAFLMDLGAVPTLRRSPDGTVFVTDNGNFIYDCRFNGIDNPEALAAALRQRAGIVESGLFLGIASVALIASEDDVTKRERR